MDVLRLYRKKIRSNRAQLELRLLPCKTIKNVGINTSATKGGLKRRITTLYKMQG